MAEPDRQGLTRRRFLQALGVAGGAGAALASMEALGLAPDVRQHTQAFRPPRSSDFHLGGRTNDTTVLVLGAGDTGLATAYELEKAGYRCEVLEARARPGGRCWTVRGGEHDVDTTGVSQRAHFARGHYFNAGPARIPQHHTTLDYCRELGVPIQVFVNANPDAFLYRDPGVGVSGPITGRPIRRRAAKADLAGYVGELLAKAADQHALDADLAPADREALIEYLRAAGVLGANDRYAGSEHRGYAAPPGAADQPGVIDPPYPLSDLLAAGLGSTFAFEQEWDQAMPMFQPVGGMDRIPYALAGALRGRLRYGAQVRGIQVRADGVEVDYTEAKGRAYRVRADYCVCTIPPSVLRKVATNFPAATTAALAGTRQMPTGKMGLQFRRRFWEEDAGILGGITDTNLDIGTITYPSYGFHGDRGILIGYYNYFAESDRFGAMTPTNRVQAALAQGVRVHGDAYRTEFETAFSVHWRNARFSEGGWVLWPDRAKSADYRTLLRPIGRLYFAGDHLTYVTAWQHGAFESARHVVTELHQRVLASARAPR